MTGELTRGDDSMRRLQFRNGKCVLWMPADAHRCVVVRSTKKDERTTDDALAGTSGDFRGRENRSYKPIAVRRANTCLASAASAASGLSFNAASRRLRASE